MILHRAAFTKPITRVIEKGGLSENNLENRILSKFEKTRQNFLDLFILLRLRKKNETMIKMQRNNEKISIFEKDGKSPEKNPYSGKQINQFINLDVKNPFQKLPKQKSLLDFSKGFADENMEKIKKEEIIRKEESNNNEEKAENLDVDYGKLLKLDSENVNDIELTEPPLSFVTKLHDYQKQALTWFSRCFEKSDFANIFFLYSFIIYKYKFLKLLLVNYEGNFNSFHKFF